jgi:hypothetical protein
MLDTHAKPTYEEKMSIEADKLDRGHEFIEYSRAFSCREVAEFFETNIETIVEAIRLEMIVRERDLGTGETKIH